MNISAHEQTNKKFRQRRVTLLSNLLSFIHVTEQVMFNDHKWSNDNRLGSIPGLRLNNSFTVDLYTEMIWCVGYWKDFEVHFLFNPF